MSATLLIAGGATLIEPSADPNIFLGLNSEGSSKFQRLRLTANGIEEIDSTTQLVKTANSVAPFELRSEGDLVVWSEGTVLNGAELKALGNLGRRGSPAIERGLDRIYLLERTQPSVRDYQLAAYDAKSLERLRVATLPLTYTTVSNLVRWGTNGFAFTGDLGLAITYSPLIVPSPAAADLSVTVEISPTNAFAGDELTFTVRATNNSANPAPNTLIVLRTGGAGVKSATATSGELRLYPIHVFADVPSIPPHGEVVITVKGASLYASGILAEAWITSSALDPVPTNNYFARTSSVGFEDGGYDSFNRVWIGAQSLATDPSRGVVWVAATLDPFGSVVVAMDPYTGRFGEPIRTEGLPHVIALSENARYLYVGFSDVPEIHRYDLTTRVLDLRIPLSTPPAVEVFAEDIEVLDGPGTSIIASLRSAGIFPHHQRVVVFDNAARRPVSTARPDVMNQIEPTGASNVFVGIDQEGSGSVVTKLLVDANGVTAGQKVSVVTQSRQITTGGTDTILTDAGQFLDVVTLTQKARVFTYGAPLIDAANDRAFQVSSYNMAAFELSTGRFIEFRTYDAGNGFVDEVVRFGDDGFVINNNTGLLSVMRWGLPFPEKVGPEIREFQRHAAGHLEFLATILKTSTNSPPYDVWGSVDLVNWTPLHSGWSAERIQATSNNGFIYETYRYMITDFSAPYRFYRLGR